MTKKWHKQIKNFENVHIWKQKITYSENLRKQNAITLAAIFIYV